MCLEGKRTFWVRTECSTIENYLCREWLLDVACWNLHPKLLGRWWQNATKSAGVSRWLLKPPRGDTCWCDFLFRYFQDITYRYTLRILNHSAPLRDDLYRTFTYLQVFFQNWGCLSVEDLCFYFGQLPYSKCWIRLSPKLQLAAWSLRPRIMSPCRGSCFLWSVTLLREWKLIGVQLSHEKNAGCFSYIEDFTTQLYRDYEKPL